MISALAITYNNEKLIERYIKNLSFADEIIFVDTFSTDNTVNLAKNNNVKIVEGKLDDYQNLLKIGVDHAKYDWIVCFDLDNLISKELIEEINSIASSSNIESVYTSKQEFMFMGKSMKHNGIKNNCRVNLFNKKNIDFSTNQQSISKIKVFNTAVQKDYLDFDSFNQQLTNKAKLKAQILFTKNIRPNVFHFFIKPFTELVNQYIVKLGFLDGKEGFILSYLKAFTVFKTYLFLWLNHRNIE